MLTDTTFWVDLLIERAEEHRARPATEFLASHRAHELRVSVITWGELAEGFREFAPLDLLLKRVKVLSLPQQVAWEASRIQRSLAERGLRLGENDAWIAATAKAWGMPVVTRDAAFERVRGLRTVAY